MRTVVPSTKKEKNNYATGINKKHQNDTPRKDNDTTIPSTANKPNGFETQQSSVTYAVRGYARATHGKQTTFSPVTPTAHSHQPTGHATNAEATNP